jgi:Rap guanine nucleotide exchange factor 2
MNFMQAMSAFANMPAQAKRDLCRCMVFALVERAGDVVMKDGEQLDSWSVIVNGEVQVVHKDARSEYRWGMPARAQAHPMLVQATHSV